MTAPSHALAVATPEPGSIYRHFKGGLYEVLTTASDAESQRTVVVYRSLDGGKVWARLLDYRVSEHPPKAWLDKVRWPDGEIRTRFVHEPSHRSNGGSDG